MTILLVAIICLIIGGTAGYMFGIAAAMSASCLAAQQQAETAQLGQHRYQQGCDRRSGDITPQNSEGYEYERRRQPVRKAESDTARDGIFLPNGNPD
jgi:hypothetical protein